MNAASVVTAYTKQTCGELDFATLVRDLRVQCEQASRGDMQRAEAMLTAQAHSLDAIFTLLAQRAARAEHIPQLEVNLRLALKAQSQSRATWETLAAIRNPSMIFAKQANIANGPQQVNNGECPHLARENLEIKPNELLETENDQMRMVPGASCSTSRSDPKMGAMETIDGPKLRKRETYRES